ncbi:MAG: DNA mismatch repair endonuclease MutL [Anaerorhabdus sp.]
MGKIQTLDTQLSNMIAAGEVVERPMGIIKELVENSIDAKSTRIEIALQQGGIQSLSVSDNGEGMDFEDAKKAFERHATSKISKTQDLWAIQTLGFRGEALPSIASVAKVILHTSNGEQSTKMVVEYGEVIEASPSPHNQGTRIEVQGLFHRTPARLKHLKTVPYEVSRVVDVVQKFALSNPSISFTLISDGKEMLRTSGKGSLIEVVYQIYGKDIAKNAIEIDAKDADYHLTGLCIHPQFNRSTRNAITIFLNGRMIKPYRIQKAIEDSYQDYLPHGRYPIVILNIQMDAKLVDVNVHPSKWEVRLSKEQQLEHFIKEAIPSALGKINQTPEINLDKVIKERVDRSTLFDRIVPIPMPTIQVQEREEDYLPQEAQLESITESISVIKALEPKPFPALRVIGQLHGKYILCEGEEGLYLIDQHAAQERVHYEEIKEMMTNQKSSQEECLVPFMLKASNDLVERKDEINQAVESLAIQFEAFGKENLIVRQTPVWMRQVDPQPFLQDLLDYFKDEREIKLEEMHQHKIATMACHHSIRFNRVLSQEEMVGVIEQLAACKQPYHCPHGRPTFICLKANQLEREFLR